MQEIEKRYFVSYQRTCSMFLSNAGSIFPESEELQRQQLLHKANAEYASFQLLRPVPEPKFLLKRKAASAGEASDSQGPHEGEEALQHPPSALTIYGAYPTLEGPPPTKTRIDPTSLSLAKKQFSGAMPEWHPPWKLYRVISGHTGRWFHLEQNVEEIDLFCIPTLHHLTLVLQRMGSGCYGRRFKQLVCYWIS